MGRWGPGSGQGAGQRSTDDGSRRLGTLRGRVPGPRCRTGGAGTIGPVPRAGDGPARCGRPPCPRRDVLRAGPAEQGPVRVGERPLPRAGEPVRDGPGLPGDHPGAAGPFRAGGRRAGYPGPSGQDGAGRRGPVAAPVLVGRRAGARTWRHRRDHSTGRAGVQRGPARGSRAGGCPRVAAGPSRRQRLAPVGGQGTGPERAGGDPGEGPRRPRIATASS